MNCTRQKYVKFESGSQTEAARPSLPIGMKWKIYIQLFFTRFLVPFVKNHHFKVSKTWPWVLPFCAQQPVSVASGPRPVYVATVSVTLGASLFLFFTSDKQTTVVLLWGAQIRSKTSAFLCRFDKNNYMNTADENICICSALLDQLCLVNKISQNDVQNSRHQSDKRTATLLESNGKLVRFIFMHPCTLIFFDC